MTPARVQFATDPRWQRIEEAVCAAMELPRQDRGAWLKQFCGDDDELRAKVDSLLKSQQGAEDFLEHSVAPYPESLLQEEVRIAAPESVGQYGVLREIGRGGMGVVYLAEREDEFKQRVAIKLVKRGLDTDEILQRFRNERQILASLNHPNIAKLFDGGMTEDRVPYFVMEFIEGEPLTKYSDQNKLSINERLLLFRRACAAVQHAHQNLIVHRDLKPSNILVTADQEVKLLDFGVAKLLSADSDGDATMTRLDQRVMTPQYASPEQIRGERVTTATDVYSLGVVLYELLAGVRPYNVKEASPEELSRAICETEPTKPSEAARDTESGRPGETDKDGVATPPRSRVSAELKGDLDNMILMALRKTPERRYKSVEQFSEDIRRHLSGLPVIARKDTFQYRASKFIARNKVAVTAATLILIAIITGAIVSVWQARVAAKERNQARQEQAKAEQLNKFLQSILSAASPEEKGKDVRVIEVLHDAAQRIQTELNGQPAIKAQALETIGETYVKLGLLSEAEANLSEAFQINSALYGSANHATTQSANFLAIALANQGNIAKAAPLLTSAIEAERKISPSGSKELALALYVLGELYVRQSDSKKATPLLLESIAMSDRILGANNEDSAFTLVSLGRAQASSGDLAAAETSLRKSVSIYSQLPPRYRGRLATSLLNLGLLLTGKGNFDEGVQNLHEGYDILDRQAGESYLLFETNAYLCTAYFNHTDNQQAVKECVRAADTGRRVKLENSADFITVLDYLGVALKRLGKSKEAEPILRESFERAQKNMTPNNSTRIIIEGALGACLLDEGKLKEAEPLLIHCYENLKATLGEKDPRTITSAKYVVALYEKLKKPSEAAKYRTLPN
jgi:eukaryotic-like serine/threonine-protein kinase